MSDRTAGHASMRKTSGRFLACALRAFLSVCNQVTVSSHKVASRSLPNNDLKTQLKHSHVLFFHALCATNTICGFWVIFSSHFLLALYLDPRRKNVASAAVVYTFLSLCVMCRKAPQTTKLLMSTFRRRRLKEKPHLFSQPETMQIFLVLGASS